MLSLKTRFGPLDCAVRQGDSATPKLTVVLCHGFGAAGDDLVSLAGECVRLRSELGQGVRFVFPQAPVSLSHLGYGPGRAWWMIDFERLMHARSNPVTAKALAKDVPAGLKEARQALASALDAMGVYSSSSGKWVLGGFSQGAMLATDVTLRTDEAPAALGLFSTTVICEDEWQKLAPRRRGLKVVQSHGTDDAVLPYFMAEAARDLLKGGGLEVEFLRFNGGHTISAEPLKHFADLLVTLI